MNQQSPKPSAPVVRSVHGAPETLWHNEAAEIACKIALGGDFLPAMGLMEAGDSVWAGKADALAAYLSDCDLAFINLEAPLNVEGLKPKAKLGLGSSLAGPAAAIDYLAALKAYVVSVANNHIYDFGADGVARTRETLVARGIVPLGAGRRAEPTPEVYVWQAPSGLRIGFWAAANNAAERASTSEEGVEVAVAERGRAALSALREQGAQCCVALLHAGCEGTNHPDPADLELMEGLSRDGFDVVAACHSHRISGYSRVDRPDGKAPGFCLHGLGSVSSGCLYSDLEREGLLAVIGFDHDGRPVSFEVRPVILEGTGWGRVPDAIEARSIMNRFHDVSEHIRSGAYREHFYRDMSQDLMKKQAEDFWLALRRGGGLGLLKKLQRLRLKHAYRLFHWLWAKVPG